MKPSRAVVAGTIGVILTSALSGCGPLETQDEGNATERAAAAATTTTTTTTKHAALYGQTITVPAGQTYDGKGEHFGKIGSGSQNESQPPVFILMKGASLKNVVIDAPAGDGIHVHGDNTLTNISMPDVGEDAVSMRSNFEGGTVTINDSSFAQAEDKVFQVNKSSTWRLNNITVNGAGKVLRQNGGTTFAMTVYINGLRTQGVKEAIVRSDSSSCRVYYRNITSNLPASKWWKGKLTATPY